MSLLAFLFWTWSLLCLMLMLGHSFGSWMSQESLSLNKKVTGQIFLTTFCLGTFFFFLASHNYLFATAALFISASFIIPLFKDGIILYSNAKWNLDLVYIKKIIPYYNPRMHWLSASSLLGILMLIWQPFSQVVNWEVLIFIIGCYYVGIVILQSQIKAYNSFIEGISSDDWDNFSQTKPSYSYQSVTYFLKKGLKSDWAYFYPLYQKMYQDAPAKYKDKLFYYKIFQEDTVSFISLLIKEPKLILNFSSEEQILILSSLIDHSDEDFGKLWDQITNAKHNNEEFIWVKINRAHKQRHFSHLEYLLALVKKSELVEELLLEVRENKLELIRSFNYLSSNLKDYEIVEDDYSRTSVNDKLFLKKYKMDLYEIFNNACVKSGERENIEIDHFFIPKSKGGSFLMKRKDGLWVVNAIILTKKNNIIKSNKKIEEIFSIEELEKINYKLKNLSIKVNYDLWGIG